MPAVSQKQQIAMSIAEHNPSDLYARNKGMTKMSHSQLHDFASTKRKGLPVKAGRAKMATMQATAQVKSEMSKSRRGTAAKPQRGRSARTSGLTPKGPRVGGFGQ